MRIAILSDIHDHVWNASAALRFVRDCPELICCGDLCSPFVMKLLVQEFPGEIHVVFGNNDADLFRITQLAQQGGGRVHLHGELALLNRGGKRIAVNHFDYIAREIAEADRYDVVCFGHNHQREITRLNAGEPHLLLLNPGTLMGVRFSQGQPVPAEATFMIYDTEAHEAVCYEVTGAGGPGQGTVRELPQ
ncbi:MAG: metallophosphoesterase family protein [Bacteroidia bacterium]|nr:metallophosphoesterase family protein [Bacteroidia bacterium]